MSTILMHADDDVCELVIANGKIADVKNLYNEKLLPVGAEKCENKDIWIRKINSWNDMRGIHADRQDLYGITDLLKTSYFSLENKIIRKSY